MNRLMKWSMKKLLMMSKVLYENERLKLVESMDEYIIIFDLDDVKIVFDDECKISKTCICKEENDDER